PPIITTSTNRIDCRKAKVEGVTKPESAAKRAPASPAQAAESAKASALIATGLRPTDSAATSESFTARIAEPQAERDRHQKPSTNSAHSAMANSATPR